MRRASLAVLCCALVSLASSSCSVKNPSGTAETMQIGPVSLEVGMSPAQVASSLPDGYFLGADRVRLLDPETAGDRTVEPFRVRGPDASERSAHPEASRERAFIAKESEPEQHLVWLTFEDDVLTRATRLVGTTDYGSNPGKDLADALIAALATWDTESETGPKVHAEVLEWEGDELRQITFTRGEKQLILVTTDRMTQLVENLGRGDAPQVRIATHFALPRRW